MARKRKCTPEELKRIRRENLRKNAAKAAEKRAAGVVSINKKQKPRHLDKIVREVLDDEELIDQIFKNQPDYWAKLPRKTGGYIIAAVMMSKAMSGDVKAADWVRKTGFGDKVSLESSDGFFAKTDFTIQVVPSKQLGEGEEIRRAKE